MSDKKLKVFANNKKRKTYLRMLRSIIGAAIVIVVILIVLQLFGINVSSMLAGVGIASIIIGFALQDAMKDIFRGLEIVSDNYYDIGDVIKFGDNMGQVLSINLRTTKIQDMNTMTEIAHNVQKLPNVTSVISQGLTSITNSSLNYQLQITCDPMNQLQVRRDALGCIATTLASHKILLPYTELTVHEK